LPESDEIQIEICKHIFDELYLYKNLLFWFRYYWYFLFYFYRSYILFTSKYLL